MSKRVSRIYALLNLVLYLGVVVVNGLANALPINGRNTGEISDSLPNYFVPTGLTFSIWGVIYLLLGIWAVRQLILSFRSDAPESNHLMKVGFWFILSSVANIGWILAWHYGFYLITLVLMLVILISLIRIYLGLGIGSDSVSAVGKLTEQIPFSVYLGWITVATVANVTALAVHLGWTGIGIPEVLWAIIAISVATVIAILLVWRHRDFAYGLVIAWAFAGIVIARTGDMNPSIPVAVTAGIAGVLVLAASVRGLITGKSA